tara:strand:- start:23306 stop:31345 length:8040 start_codon:yes stop_codon:yes gene_type:complete
LKEVKTIASAQTATLTRSNFNTLKHTFFQKEYPQTGVDEDVYYWWGEADIFDGEQPYLDYLNGSPQTQWCGAHVEGGDPLCLALGEDELPEKFYESFVTVDSVKWSGTGINLDPSLANAGVEGRGLDFSAADPHGMQSGATGGVGGHGGGRTWAVCITDFLRKNSTAGWIKPEFIAKESVSAALNTAGHKGPNPEDDSSLAGWQYGREEGLFSVFGNYEFGTDWAPGAHPFDEVKTLAALDIIRAEKHIEPNTEKKSIRYEISIPSSIWHRTKTRAAVSTQRAPAESHAQNRRNALETGQPVGMPVANPAAAATSSATRAASSPQSGVLITSLDKSETVRYMVAPWDGGPVPDEPNELHMCTFTLGNIGAYVDLAIALVGQIERKVRSYGINFARPVDLQFQIENLGVFKSIARSLAQEIGTVYRDDSAITMIFDNKFEILDFRAATAGERATQTIPGTSHPASPILPFSPFDNQNPIAKYSQGPGTGPGDEINKVLDRPGTLRNNRVFENVTTNSLIFNLKRIYDRYHTRFSLLDITAVIPTQDSLRTLMNDFFYPEPSYTNSFITEKLISKFILGDTRLLDDDFYKKSQPTPMMMGASFRQSMRQEIEKQYEFIGDQLGGKLVQGKFEQIDDHNDFFESLMNYISIPEMMKIVATCLIRLLHLRELVDLICSEVLEEFEKHQENIIGYLESVGKGNDPLSRMNRALALELKELYFGLVDEAVNYTGQIVEGSFKSLLETIDESTKRETWRSRSEVVLFVEKIAKQRTEKEKQMFGSEGIPDPGSITERIVNLTNRKGDMQEVEEAQIGKIDLLQGGPAEKLSEYMSFEEDLAQGYGEEIGEIQTKIDRLEKQRVLIGAEQQLYAFLYDQVLPSCVALIPYFDPKIKPVGESLAGGRPWPFDIPDKIDAIQKLNGLETAAIVALNTSTHAPASGLLANINWTIPDSYSIMNVKSQRKEMEKIFQNSVLAQMKLILRAIESLESAADSPLNEFKASIAEGVSGAAQQALTDVFGKGGRKKALLCAAIFAAVPGAIYLIIELIKNWEDIKKAIVEDSGKVWKALKRRAAMFWPTNFPWADILQTLKETAQQLALNLIRDVVVTAVLHLMKELEKACSDEEKTNAPYSPVGQVDLGNYMVASRTNDANKVEDTPSFKKITMETELTLREYKEIIDAISSSFSIRQTCSLLDVGSSGEAPYGLYMKVIEVLKSLEFLKNTTFEEMYLNSQGIRVFFATISKDIEPEFCVQAQNTFDNQKKLLLSICTSTNEEILESELGKFLTPEELKKSMADTGANRRKIIGEVLDLLGLGLGEPYIVDTKCAPGKPGQTNGLHDSQKFALQAASKSIFGNLEKMFEMEASRIKLLYKDVFNTLRSNSFPPGNMRAISKAALEGESIPLNTPSDGDAPIRLNASEIDAATGANKYVAVKLRNKLLKNYDHPPFEQQQFGKLNYFKTVYDGNKETGIIFRYHTDTRRLLFEYDKTSEPNVVIQLAHAIAPENEDSVIVEYTANEKVPEDFAMASLWLSGLGHTQSPNIIPAILEMTKEYNFRAMAMNAIFQQTVDDSLQSSLFTAEKFAELNINQNFKDDNCFLGYFNQHVLSQNVKRIAEELYCYTQESATKTSINIAFVKVSLDCVIRAIVAREFLKLLFVVGFVPAEELFGYTGKGKTSSFFYKYLLEEIQKALSGQFQTIAGSSGVANFHTDIIEEYITGTMRILYQEKDMSHKEALAIVINQQVQFVKEIFGRGLPKGMSPSGNNEWYSGFMQVADILELEEGESPGLGQGEYIYLGNQTASAKLRLLLNDYLQNLVGITPGHYYWGSKDGWTGARNYRIPKFLNKGDIGFAPGTTRAKMAYNSVIGSPEIVPTGDDTQGTGILKKTGWATANPGAPIPDALFMTIPGLHRYRRDMSYMISTSVNSPPPGSANEIYEVEDYLKAARPSDGFAMESMFEVKFKNSFYSNLSQAQILNLQFFFNSLTHFYQSDTETRYLKMFLYSSGIIMFFPQIHTTLNVENTIDREKLTKTDFLWQMFRYNFDGGMSAEEKESLYKTWENQQTHTSPEPCVDWAMAGKIHLNDFWAITREFMAPSYYIPSAVAYVRYKKINKWYTPLDQLSGKHKINLVKPVVGHMYQYSGNAMDVHPWDKQGTFPTPNVYFNGETDEEITREDAFKLYYDKYSLAKSSVSGDATKFYSTSETDAYTNNGPIKSFMHRWKTISDGAIQPLIENMLELFPVTEIEAAQIDDLGLSPKNIFSWLFSRDINDIFDFSAVSRISQYIDNNTMNSLNINVLSDFKSIFTNKLSTENLSKEEKLAQWKDFTDEKIGPVYFHSKRADGTASPAWPTFVTPNFTASESLPKNHGTDNLWYSFLYHTNPALIDMNKTIEFVDFKSGGSALEPAQFWEGPQWATYSISNDPSAQSSKNPKQHELSMLSMLWEAKMHPSHEIAVALAPFASEKEFYSSNFSETGQRVLEYYFEDTEYKDLASIIVKLQLEDELVVWQNLNKDSSTKQLDYVLKMFFLKEQATLLAISHRMGVESTYPEINNMFDGTLSTASENLLAAISVANGDYQRQSDLNKSSESSFAMEFDFGSFGQMILKAMLGSMASAVDPFWKTDWFSPGPFTPFGIAAKLMDEYGSGDWSYPDYDKENKKPKECIDVETESYLEYLQTLEEFEKNIYKEDT